MNHRQHLTEADERYIQAQFGHLAHQVHTPPPPPKPDYKPAISAAIAAGELPYTANDFYFLATNRFFKHPVLLCKVKQPDPMPAASYLGPKIPYKLFLECVQFNLLGYQKIDAEVQITAYLNPETGEWKAWPFIQTGIGMSTHETDCPENTAKRDEFRAAGFETQGLCFTMHNHCDSSSFQSGIDSADELKRPGIHITIGKLKQHKIDIHVRIVANFNGQSTPSGHIVCGPNSFQWEPRWLDIIDFGDYQPWAARMTNEQLTEILTTKPAQDMPIPEGWLDCVSPRQVTPTIHTAPRYIYGPQQAGNILNTFQRNAMAALKDPLFDVSDLWRATPRSIARAVLLLEGAEDAFLCLNSQDLIEDFTGQAATALAPVLSISQGSVHYPDKDSLKAQNTATSYSPAHKLCALWTPSWPVALNQEMQRPANTIAGACLLYAIVTVLYADHINKMQTPVAKIWSGKKPINHATILRLCKDNALGECFQVWAQNAYDATAEDVQPPTLEESISWFQELLPQLTVSDFFVTAEDFIEAVQLFVFDLEAYSHTPALMDNMALAVVSGTLLSLAAMKHVMQPTCSDIIIDRHSLQGFPSTRTDTFAFASPFLRKVLPTRFMLQKSLLSFICAIGTQADEFDTIMSPLRLYADQHFTCNPDKFALEKRLKEIRERIEQLGINKEAGNESPVPASDTTPATTP